MHGIGQMARECGLTVSALRFYDGAGVLVPAWVDPQSGYRWYRPEQVREARLIARLRRVGLPLADICRVLEHRHDRVTVDAVLDAHLRRLEDGLADARRELSAARNHIECLETAVMTPRTTNVTLAVSDLVAALRSVRFAVSSDPNLPMLGGVLLDFARAELRAVATDRYRLAVASAPVSAQSGPDVSALVPVELVDDVLIVLQDQPGEVAVAVEDRYVSFTSAGTTRRGDLLDFEFPEWERVVRLPAAQGIRVDTARLRADLTGASARTMRREQDGADYDVIALACGPDGGLSVAAADDAATGSTAVNREFMLQALDAGAGAELLLELDGPISPLAIRNPDQPGTFSLLMPTRLS